MRHRTAVLVLALLLSGVQALSAQRRVSLNVAGGVSLPQGDLADQVSPGWHGLATVDLGSPMLPQGLRFDLAYAQFGFDDAVGSGNTSVMSGTLNFTYRLPSSNSPLSPYLIAGLGAYRTDCTLATCDAATRYGWNFGLGTKLYVLGLRSFVETRYHLTKFHGTPVHYFPLTFGISF
jgi:Outer membrane protein beta-barrel domain